MSETAMVHAFTDFKIMLTITVVIILALILIRGLEITWTF
jgi:competence protein ComGF